MTTTATPAALRIIAHEMREKGPDFRTDELGIDALCLEEAADEIDRLCAENKRLRAALKQIAHGPFQAVEYIYLFHEVGRVAREALGGKP